MCYTITREASYGLSETRDLFDTAIWAPLKEPTVSTEHLTVFQSDLKFCKKLKLTKQSSHLAFFL